MRALGIGRIMPFLFLFLDTTDILAVEAQVKLSGRLHVLIDALVKKGGKRLLHFVIIFDSLRLHGHSQEGAHSGKT